MRTGLPAWVLATGLANPDDLLFQDGVTYVGQIDSGRVATVAPGLPVVQSRYLVPRAEGLAMVGGRLFIADQQNDRIDVIVDDQPQTFLQLTPVPGRDNVDGIAAQGDQLLVPDSPNGTLLWVDREGHVVRSVGGFVRPTGAWPLPDGSVLVADEYGNAALRVAPDGGRTFLVQGLPIVDDVAADADGHVMVITPVTSGGRLAELVEGTARDLAGNLLEPQGLGFDDAGNVLVTESAAGRLDLFIRTFKLVPAAGLPAAGEALCLNLVRAPGFNDPVQLSGEGLRVLRQPGAGSQATLLLEACRPRCQVIATSGSRRDRLWITG